MIADYKTAALALSGIQHLWMLDEASGTSAADSQGSTTLTWGADVSGFLTTGPDGTAQCPVNNGSTNRVAINASITPPSTATYFWWQRQDVDATDDSMIFEFGTGGIQRVQCDYAYSGGGAPSGKALFSFDYGNSNGGATAYFTKGTTGVWDFYCMTCDPSQAFNAQIKIYRNGSLISTDNSISAGSQTGLTAGAMTIGVLGRNSAGTRQLPIKAAMCGFGMTNTLLSTGTMTSLRNAMLGAKTGTDSGTGSDSSSAMLVAPQSSSSATLATDDFTGSAARLTAHTPSGSGASGTWSDDGHAIYVGLTGSGDVYCAGSTGSQTSHSTFHSQTVTDGAVQCDCIVQGSGTGYVELNIRSDQTGSPANGNNRYEAVFDNGGNVGTGRVELYKIVSGVQTQLGSTYNSGSAWSGTHSFKVEAIGTTIKVYVDGVAVITVTDSSHSSGKTSIAINTSNSASTSVGVHADNYLVTSAGVTATPSDSGTGSETSSVIASGVLKGHPSTGATFDAVATIQQGTGATQELFPAMCLKNDGTLLRISRAGTAHLSTDGNLISSTSSDNGATWSAQSTILNTANDLRAGVPRLLANGKIIVSIWDDAGSGTPRFKTYTMLSTDKTATAWDAPVALPNHTGAAGNACESPVVEMPNGDLLLVVYESESSSATTGWSTVLYKSTDGGASWTFSTYIARSADSAAPPQALYEEPFLLRLFNGDLVCAIRQSEQGFTASTLRYVHLWRSTDSGVNWTDEGRVFSSFQSASRNAMFQTRDGALVLQARILGSAGASKQGAYIVSDDNGDTWGTLRNLEDGTATANATSPPVYSYGDITQLANGKLAQIWVDETPLSGSTPAIRFATYSLTGAEAQDTGTGTEGISNVQIVLAPVTANDAGTGAESSSVTVFSLVPEAGSDTGSFSESSNVQATVLFTSVAVSDAGAAVDGATVVVVSTGATSTADPSHQGQVARGYGGRIGGGNQGRVKITA